MGGFSNLCYRVHKSWLTARIEDERTTLARLHAQLVACHGRMQVKKIAFMHQAAVGLLQHSKQTCHAVP